MSTFEDPRAAAGDPVTDGHKDTLLYESGRTRVVRRQITCPEPTQASPELGYGVVAGAMDVIWKEPLGLGARDRVRHESGILGCLAGVPGVAHLVSPGPALAGELDGLTLEDVGGATLASTLAGPATAEHEALDPVVFALALARVLTGVHQAGVMHKDINPANILLAGPERRPVLIDWDLATTFAVERPGFTHESRIVGTLAYLAPEQTGRTGRSVDQRADLYALGATLYEVAVGRPPFGNGDALSLIHDHLARVPVAPSVLNPTVPALLSDIILRLLEKEPDRRYQSAQGLAHDLARLHARFQDARLQARTEDSVVECGQVQFALGERDFPIRICAPSQLVGRDSEIGALSAALDQAVAGQERGLLVTGAPGVGKSSLVGEVRSMVTARNGWFVQGKFDQHRQDESTDAVAQVMRALARLLLAEPEDQLVPLRNRIRATLGADADVLAAFMPEFAVLLGITPADLTGDRHVVGAQIFQAGLGLLRAVASPQRPLVMVVDDLQWAGAFPIAFLDAILMDDDLSGLLLVGAYRDGEVDAAHPLNATLARWDRLGITPTSLRLTNLPPPHLSTMLAQMLRLPPERARDLSEVINARTKGNPYDTVELVNALRLDGALSIGDTGWHWDTNTIQHFVGHGDVLDLLTARIEALPAGTVSLLDVLACLGGDVNLELLALAAGLDGTATTGALTAALEDGLLVMIHDAAPAVRFRHDRVQQAAAARLAVRPRQLLQRHIARRLAAHPQLEAAAAEQYLACAPDACQPGERYRVAVLFRAAAAHARVINQVRSERFLAAALALLSFTSDEPEPAITEFDLITQLLIERHAALSNLARFEEADELYDQIERRIADPVDLADAAAVQITGLTNRDRAPEAVALGMDLLTRLGFEPPALEDVPAAMGSSLELLYSWVAQGPQPDELTRPEPSDPRILAAVSVLERICPAAYAMKHPLMPWLTFQAHRFWVEHGPCARLVSSLGGLSVMGVLISQDYAVGYQAGQRILRVSQDRGYEPATSQLRCSLTLFTTSWFEPIEQAILQSRIARESLLRYGELLFVSITYASTLDTLFDSAATLDQCRTECTAAAGFNARIGNEAGATLSSSYRQLLNCLAGETNGPGDFNDDTFDEASFLDGLREFPVGLVSFHNRKAFAAMLFGDARQLASHSAEALRALPFAPGLYASALTHLLRGIALAEQVKTAHPDERSEVIAEFDVSRNWLAARGADAPANFAHLVRWLDAERAWATNDVQAALHAFEAAMSEVARQQRPWQEAMITERAARFHLAHDLTKTGLLLLNQARIRYQSWGATAKTRELDQEFPGLKTTSGPGQHCMTPSLGSIPGSLSGSIHSGDAFAESIDLMAVLRAAQVLSSETNLDRLRFRVVDVLTTMTGATSVRLLLWNPDAQAWFLPTTSCPTGTNGTDGINGLDGETTLSVDGETTLSVDEAGQQGLICVSAFRYAERTLQPLLIPEATRDDRFARDPYLQGLDACSLLVVPVLSRGVPRAMLLIENRLSHGAFTTDRLDAVVLIAGQLAVCLDNALAERFRSLVQRSSDLTLVCDRAGAISYASTASVEILGIENTDLLTRPLLDLIHPDDQDAVTTWITQDGLSGLILECRLQPGTTKPRWVEISCTDLTADPAVAALVLHLRDITDRRTLESDLRHAQKLESVGQLAAGIAHEINTPIQFITANLEFLTESLTPITALLDGYRTALTEGDLATRHQALLAQEADIDLDFLREEIPMATTQAIEGTQRIAAIVRAMKAFAHPGGEGKDLCDLNEALRNTLIVADSQINPVADVVLHLDPDLPAVRCNLGDINQALLNLIINAAYAITEATKTGSTPIRRGTLTVRTRADDGAVLIDIHDTGNGIPADIADRIFDQFFTTKPVGVGTGQGLSLAHTLIHDRHQGTITFTTEPGLGTTFTIRLPNTTSDEP